MASAGWANDNAVCLLWCNDAPSRQIPKMDGPSVVVQVDRFNDRLDTGIILEHGDYKAQVERVPDPFGIDRR
jgi:hypothetical protein